MRLNKYGDTLWTKTFLANAAFQIEKLSDGNYVISGLPHDPVIKIDINGNVIWIKNNLGGYIKGSMDSGFFNAAGYRIKKYDNSGDSVWSFNYLSLIGYDLLTDYSIGPDNSVLIIGFNNDTTNNKIIIKLSASGKLIFKKRFISELGPSKLINLNNKQFVFSGANGFSAILAKFDFFGNLIWFKSYDIGYPEYVEIFSFIKTNDNGFALAGAYHNGNYHYYMRIIKTDSLGNEQWRNIFMDIMTMILHIA